MRPRSRELVNSGNIGGMVGGGMVIVLGSINMDLVVRVDSLPRPGDTVLGDRLLTVPGGKGANQAVAAARLGGSVRMIGRVGADAFGEQLLAGLRADGVDVSGVTVDDSEPTGSALIVIDKSGQNMVTVAPGANAAVGAGEVERVRQALGPNDVLVIQLEIPLPAVLAAIEAAGDAGARVILNAAPVAAMKGQPVPRVDLLIVNEGEAEALGGVAVRDSVGAMAVTLGESGADLYENGRTTHVDAHQVTAIDATGAGDALVGAAAFELARGSSIEDAIRLGGAAGAAAVTKMGAQPSLPTPADLRRLFGILVGRT